MDQEVGDATIADNEVVFAMFKNILLQESKRLLQEIAKDFKRSDRALNEKYLRPEFYLPIIRKTDPPRNLMNIKKRACEDD